MSKLTLNENLVPCEREPWACDRFAHDLTNNLTSAEIFANIATKFFALRKGSVRFSGYVRKGNDGLQIKVWDGQQLYRTIRYRNIRFSAVLHVVAKTDYIKNCLGDDTIGDLGASECLAGFS
jgi:hypothetical protein